MKTIIYCVNLGGYDRFHNETKYLSGYEHYYVTDNFPTEESSYKFILVKPERGDLKRDAGYYKTHSHLMPPHDISLYIDGSVKLRRSPAGLIDRFIRSGVDIMIPDHPNRNCTYSEAQACKDRYLDSHALIDSQMRYYKHQNFPAGNGMLATTMIFRRNNERVARFNKLWWRQITAFSLRDQLSVMFALWNSDATWKALPLNIYRNKFFKKCKHA